MEEGICVDFGHWWEVGGDENKVTGRRLQSSRN